MELVSDTVARMSWCNALKIHQEHLIHNNIVTLKTHITIVHIIGDTYHRSVWTSKEDMTFSYE